MSCNVIQVTIELPNEANIKNLSGCFGVEWEIDHLPDVLQDLLTLIGETSIVSVSIVLSTNCPEVSFLENISQ